MSTDAEKLAEILALAERQAQHAIESLSDAWVPWWVIAIRRINDGATAADALRLAEEDRRAEREASS